MASKRNEPSKDITRIEATAAALAPFLEADTSLDALAGYTVLPRLKLIQAMTEDALKQQFGEGSAIIRPGDAMIASRGDEFEFVPLAFYAEFCKWSDRRDKESPSIVARDYDPESEIAQRAADPERRFEIYEGHATKSERDQWKYRYVHHLNFPGVIYGDHPLAGTQLTLSFARGEYGTGSRLINSIQLRRMEVNGAAVRVPLWAQVWAFKPMLREQDDRKWYGLDYMPAEIPMILQEEVTNFQGMHTELMDLITKRRLRTNLEEEEVEITGGDY